MSVLDTIKEKTSSVLKKTDTFLRNDGAKAGIVFAGIATMTGFIGGLAMAGFPGLEGVSNIANLPVSDIMIDTNQHLNVAIASFGVAYAAVGAAALSKVYSVVRGGKVEIDESINNSEVNKNKVVNNINKMREKSFSNKNDNTLKLN